MNHSTEIERLLDTLLSIANQISEGKTPLYEHKELYTSGAFDSVIQGIKDPGVSYAILQILIKNYKGLIKLQRTVYFELLYCLIVASDTTEVPEGMKEIIQEHSDNETISSIKKWYRIQ